MTTATGGKLKHSCMMMEIEFLLYEPRAMTGLVCGGRKWQPFCAVLRSEV